MYLSIYFFYPLSEYLIELLNLNSFIQQQYLSISIFIILKVPTYYSLVFIKFTIWKFVRLLLVRIEIRKM